MPSASWKQLVEAPGAERHIVQLYRDEAFLGRVVAAWILPAARAGGGGLLVCAPEHAQLVRAHAGEAFAQAEREGRIVVLDARVTMARFLRGGEPRADLFAAIVRDALSSVRAACPPGAEVRAWGEMVNLLWREGRSDAAQALEAFWNEAIDACGFRLLCSYELDNLAEATYAGQLQRVCAGHTQLIPEEDDDALEAAVAGALVDVYGEQTAGVVRAQHARRRVIPIEMPAAQAVLVALHDADPDAAQRVLARTRARML